MRVCVCFLCSFACATLFCANVCAYVCVCNAVKALCGAGERSAYRLLDKLGGKGQAKLVGSCAGVRVCGRACAETCVTKRACVGEKVDPRR
jgi:hypothetical protein